MGRLDSIIYSTIATYMADSAGTISSRTGTLKLLGERQEVTDQIQELQKLADRAKAKSIKAQLTGTIRSLESSIGEKAPSIGNTYDATVLVQKTQGTTAVLLPAEKDSALVAAFEEVLGKPDETYTFGGCVGHIYNRKVQDSGLKKATRAATRALSEINVKCNLEELTVDLQQGAQTYRGRKVTLESITAPKKKAAPKPKTEKPERVYTVNEAAKLTKYQPSGIKKHIRHGNIKASETDGEYLIPRSALEAFVASYHGTLPKDKPRALTKKAQKELTRILGRGDKPEEVLRTYQSRGYRITARRVEILGIEGSNKSTAKPWADFSKDEQGKILNELKSCKPKKDRKEKLDKIKEKHKIDGRVLHGVFLSRIQQGKGN